MKKDHIESWEEAVKDILRTPTAKPAATATLVELLGALDARERCREKLVVKRTERSRERTEIA